MTLSCVDKNPVALTVLFRVPARKVSVVLCESFRYVPLQ